VIQQVLMQTVVLREFAQGVRALQGDLGFESRAEGPMPEELGRALGISTRAHPRFAVLGAPGVARGFIRLVEGPSDDLTGSFHKRGLFNAELLTRDVEALHDRLKTSTAFRLVSELNTYDLSGAGGGAISRSFATRGPGGAGFFFTQYLKVPPPRVLPVCETLVGPMFNAAVSIDEQVRVEAFYETVLGLTRRLAGRLTQPPVNRIIGLPDDWGFMMLVYKGEGDGLIEVDIHEHEVPAEPAQPHDQLRPGNSMITLEARDLDDILRRAAEAGFPGTDPQPVASWPYQGRRAAVLRGPAGERVEMVDGGS
jgi:catechol 2,3-dioxygenase-like lactoylglutathione lyase family enzyme